MDALKCSGCGATPEVKPGADWFDCAYCRSKQRVGRAVERSSQKTRSTSPTDHDRAESQRAISRIEAELSRLETERQAELKAARVRAGWAGTAPLPKGFFVCVALAALVWWKFSFWWALIPAFAAIMFNGHAELSRKLTADEVRINDTHGKRADELRAQLEVHRKMLGSPA